MPKEEKIVTEEEFKKEIRKHLLVMKYTKKKLNNFTVLKKLLIITSPFAIGYLIYGYFLYLKLDIGFDFLFLIGIIPFLVSLIFNSLILSWSRGRIIDICLALIHLIEYVGRESGKVAWSTDEPINLDDIMKMGEETLEREDDGEKIKEGGI